MPSFRSLLLSASLLLPFAAAPLLTGVHASPEPNATLALALPYASERSGSGTLTTDLLDPEDHLLAHAEHPLNAIKGDGTWQQSLTPGQPVPYDEVVYDRIRYRFTFTDGGTPIEATVPVASVLRRPVVRILGQSEYLAGSQAALRVVVADATNNAAPLQGTLRIELGAEDGKDLRQIYTGHLDRRGTADAQFRLPAGITGSRTLRITAETPICTASYTQTIQLADKSSILLTTEKPIYQPGQTVHIRALALDRASHNASATRPLSFELEDARGNKIFRRALETDAFGIASAEFTLADEVNLGAWHLRALMGTPDAPTSTAEATLNIQRYVLPKFKVAVDFTQNGSQTNGKPKRDYRPGDHVTGTVHANYFFGKPVEAAEITIKASAADVAVFEAASSTGKTDAQGNYRFDLKLPSYFAGKPLTQGAARALVEATVRDSADHAETRGEPITISQSALLVTAVPEGGTLAPRLENHVYLVTAYPDGAPAPGAALTVHLKSGNFTLTSSASGVALLKLGPGQQPAELAIDADDHHGNRATVDAHLDLRDGTDQVLLRTSQAVVKAGDRVTLTVLSTRATGTAYVDIVRNGQTFLTRDLDLQNGQATLTLTATQEMAGTLDLNAYVFGRDAQPVADHRLLFVQPAGELKIEASTDASVYKPGGQARIRFHVTNTRGEGVAAALGLQIVDEAVFALAEKQPGFAKVFFYLEQEVMKPRFEVNSLSMPGIIGAVSKDAGSQGAGSDDLAAQALFSATELAVPRMLDAEFGRALPQAKQAEFTQRYQQAFQKQVRMLAEQLSRRPHASPQAFAASAGAPRDSWGRAFQIQPTGAWSSGPGQTYLLVRSAGPDGSFNSSDDLSTYLLQNTARHAYVNPTPEQGGRFNLDVVHDRGAFNGRAELTGKVVDPTGAIIPGAKIQLSSIDTRQALPSTTANGSGEFDLSGLAPLRYTLTVTSQGFKMLQANFTLAPRDRAVLTATLYIGSQTESVSVASGEEYILATPPPPRAMPMGIMGGIRAAGAGMAAAPIAKQAFAEDAVVINTEAIQDLPINSRNATYTLRLKQPATPAATEAHVRSWFPEALYINPEILTDGHGNAEITIPVADSITTWRMAMMASTTNGMLGSATSSLKVFQDFFVDLDLPVTLTQGDRVSLPVAIYNYSASHGDVSLKLQPDPWYTLVDDSADKSVEVDAGKVGGSHFTLSANRIGKFKLKLTAHMQGHDDTVVREIEVIPNGREASLVFNGRLDPSTIEQGKPCTPPVICDTFGASSGSATPPHKPGNFFDLRFPADAIPDATTLFVRLYPGPLSQVIEGMDSILRMPYGCFEQTSSSTYPNVLALDYMKRTGKLTPEVHAKAEGFIANGYQRLLTFEVPGGGFSWFGQAPANKILTGYGLMEFSDMSRVSQVDPRLIERTRDWLVQQQQPDGSWKPDTQFINEGATNRFNSDVLRITAYLAWSLTDAGYRGPALEKAERYIQSHASGKVDPYTLAVIASFATEYTDRDFAQSAIKSLLDARIEKDEESFWTSEETGVYSTGQSAAVETTGLAIQALLRSGQSPAVVRKALAFVLSKKLADGNWGTTQATIMALRALLSAAERGSADTRGQVQILLNGKQVESLDLTRDNNDLLHQFVFKGIDPTQPAHVELRFTGSGSPAYQVAGRYYTPWGSKQEPEALAIDVAYDRTTLAESDLATATATVTNKTGKTANMIMVDLGIPPGFDLLSEDLQTMIEHTAHARTGKLEKFSQTATQAILYFNALAPGQTVKIRFRLRAKYPIKAKTFKSRVYEYYTPDVNATAQPTQLEVHQR